ncbi:MAG: TetR/AcrR family transcriptional regulator [Streptomyces sp.]|uniref:TetR/AcrR family transcriptional regulator n=1 Tax=Streptomyces sp. TaxID=1931 RepID=UPI0025D903AC|nr:TetR/AcrR family transcriptional regulator [Streptomyces sp.]MBW8795360.1 TetR/AcrR family transcriptional regulator [Streptomyces sp.]
MTSITSQGKQGDSPDGTRPRRRRKTGTYAAADERRKLIIESAIGHFAQWGYHNSSLPKIAADVGISPAGLLHHFGNKRELLMAVLQARAEHATRTFYEGMGDPDGMDALDMLRRMAAQTEFNLTQPGLVQMYSVLSAEAANPEHPAHAYFRERYDTLLGRIERTLRHGVASGLLREDVDCAAVARELIGVSDGFQVQWALSGGRWDMLGAFHAYLDRLARTLTRSGHGLS